MLLTNKSDYSVLQIEPKDVMKVTENFNGSTLHLKDNSTVLVDEKAFHVKTLIYIELTAKAKAYEAI